MGEMQWSLEAFHRSGWPPKGSIQCKKDYCQEGSLTVQWRIEKVPKRYLALGGTEIFAAVDELQMHRMKACAGKMDTFYLDQI